MKRLFKGDRWTRALAELELTEAEAAALGDFLHRHFHANGWRWDECTSIGFSQRCRFRLNDVCHKLSQAPKLDRSGKETKHE